MDVSPATTPSSKTRIKRLKQKRHRSIRPSENYASDIDNEKYPSSPKHIHITHLHQDKQQTDPVNNMAGHQVKTEVLTERFRILRNESQKNRPSMSNSNSELGHNGKNQSSQGAVSVSHVIQHKSPSIPAKQMED